jgi:hypothetical protein
VLCQTQTLSHCHAAYKSIHSSNERVPVASASRKKPILEDLLCTRAKNTLCVRTGALPRSLFIPCVVDGCALAVAQHHTDGSVWSKGVGVEATRLQKETQMELRSARQTPAGAPRACVRGRHGRTGRAGRRGIDWHSRQETSQIVHQATEGGQRRTGHV